MDDVSASALAVWLRVGTPHRHIYGASHDRQTPMSVVVNRLTDDHCSDCVCRPWAEEGMALLEAAAGQGQGLTLVHISAQRKQILRDTLCT
jgi:hypothetical protein